MWLIAGLSQKISCQQKANPSSLSGTTRQFNIQVLQLLRLTIVGMVFLLDYGSIAGRSIDGGSIDDGSIDDRWRVADRS